MSEKQWLLHIHTLSIGSSLNNMLSAGSPGSANNRVPSAAPKANCDLEVTGSVQVVLQGKFLRAVPWLSASADAALAPESGWFSVRVPDAGEPVFQVWSSPLKGGYSRWGDRRQPAKGGVAVRGDEFREDKLLVTRCSLYMTIHTTHLTPWAVGGLEIEDQFPN